ncbi:MAG: hypothetical protein WCW25_03575 [Patescibacteria group bacterium]|jgi:hypothetical protein
MARENIISSSRKILSPGRFYIKYWGLINLLLMLVIIAAGTLFLLKPKYEKARAEMETDLLRKEIERSRQDLKKMNAVSGIFAGISDEEKEKVAAIIPYQENFENLLPLIETIVRKNGLVIVSLDVAKEEEQLFKTRQEQLEEQTEAENSAEFVTGEKESLPPEIGEIKINLTVGGADYRGFKSLLANFESNLRLMDVTNVGFTEGKNVSLEMYTYFLKR